MITAQTLLTHADRYLAITGLPETTLSYRIFEDTKKIADLRRGRDITLGRFGMAMRWLAANWPEGHAVPDELAPWAPGRAPTPTPEEDAA
jgi:hypothetical protein